MEYLLFVASLLASSSYVFAGRAFPIDAENWVQSRFATINRNLEWDVTNFLVDLSAQYAHCKNNGQYGKLQVGRKTPEGQTVGGLIESTPGKETHVDAVNQYIKAALTKWTTTEPFASQISKATTFGCSVQPGCEGRAVIACLFSPGNGLNNGNVQEPEPVGEPAAKAFTREQYSLTETATGKRWDRSHLLENLSGFETSCSMIGKRDWAFTTAEREARKRGLKIVGLYGSTPNRGSTEEGMMTVIRSWKSVQAKQLGCSVIPDCLLSDRSMYIVVSCLFAV